MSDDEQKEESVSGVGVAYFSVIWENRAFYSSSVEITKTHQDDCVL